MDPHQIRLMYQPTSRAQATKGEHLVDSSTSVVLTPTKQGASGLDLDLVLDPNLIKLPRMDLLRLRLNLQP
jgi:hypothetical protein